MQFSLACSVHVASRWSAVAAGWLALRRSLTAASHSAWLHAVALVSGIGLIAVTATPSVAGLLIDPSGGVTLWNSAVSVDDQVQTRALPFSATFFGATITSVDVSTNGNWNLGSSDSYGNTSLPTSPLALFAPLWDDLSIFAGSGQSIVEKAEPGAYYSVTWDVGTYNDPAPEATSRFQAILFGATTTVGGITFLPNDVVFAYDRVSARLRGGDATVGMNQGNGIDSAFLASTPGGIVTDATRSVLPTEPGAVSLFRPAGSGYTASVVTTTAIPEIDPAGLGSVLALVTGALGLVERKKRRRS